MKTVNISEEELERLKAKNRAQAWEITHLTEVLVRKNLDLDALGFVWCDGGCTSGVHRFSPEMVLTADMVLRAEQNTKRLRSWYETVRWRLGKFPTMSAWHEQYAKRSAARTDLLKVDSSDQETETPSSAAVPDPESSDQ